MTAFDAADEPVVWEPSARQMLSAPAPHMVLRDRILFRSLAALAARRLVSISGIEHIGVDRDPFILAPNHSTWIESVLVPSFLVIRRGGKLIHFLADWNFRIVPGIGLIFRRGQVVTVARKDSKPKFLTVFRRFYEDPVPAMERARLHVTEGRPIGIFPEGTVNRDPERLLVGRVGMARLSLETGVPVVPVGIRYPESGPGRPAKEYGRMAIEIGPPMHPPSIAGPPSAGATRHWHTAIMGEISRLSGKAWGR